MLRCTSYVLCAPKLGHEASRTRTEVPQARPRTVLGPGLARFGPVWGWGGRGVGGSPEPKIGIRGRHHWGRATTEFQTRANAGADFVLWCACCCCCLFLLWGEGSGNYQLQAHTLVLIASVPEWLCKIHDSTMILVETPTVVSYDE